MACDTCGKTGEPLVDLLSTYQTRDVKSICYECEKVVNAQHGRLLSMVLNIKTALLKRFIAQRCRKIEPVMYVDNRGEFISRVSDEQVEAVLGPVVDRIRKAVDTNVN